jgi:microcompartment protein CcmK/EutM
MVALGMYEVVEWVLVIAGSMARRMHSRSYSGLAMLVSCHVYGVLLPLDEKTMFSK